MAMGAAVRDLERVFTTGSVTGLTEGQLLDRFVHRGDELAFEALVSRHGPMVMGVCRRILRDTNDVDDAFQATFLVLVRKAGTLRQTDLLGNWLYGVASKVALRARSLGSRRPSLESSGVEPLAKPEALFDESQTLHEELRRLPEKYRAAVVLCYLEGLTHEQAAERLEWPVGTVKGRLSRAKDLLKSRLSRRGVALSTTLAVANLLATNAQASVPPALLQTTLKASALAATGKPLVAGVVSAQAVSLTEGVLATMSLTKIKIAAAGLALAGTLFTSAGVYAYQGSGIASEVQPPTATKAAAAESGGSGPPVAVAPAPAPAADDKVPKGTAPAAVPSPGSAVERNPAPANPNPAVAQQGGGAMAGGGGFGGGMGGFGGGGMGEGPAAAAVERVRTSRIRSLIAEAGPKMAELDKTPATRMILKKLETSVSLNFSEDTPLSDVLRYIKSATAGENDSAIPVYVDPAGLIDAGQTLTSPVKISLDGVPLRTSLRLLLKQLDLAYCVKEGLLIISSPEGILDELREFESANVPPDSRTIPPLGVDIMGGMGGGIGGGGMGGGFR